VERTQVRPPSSRVGPITPEERRSVMAASPLRGKYDTAVDNETAYEILQKRRRLDDEPAQDQPDTGGLGGMLGGLIGQVLGTAGAEPAPAGRGRKRAGGGRPRMTTGELIVRNASSSIARTVGSGIGRAIVRGVLGGMLK